MKVKDLIVLLQQCDPEAECVINAPFRGFEAVNVIERRKEHGGVGWRMSFETIPTVEITNGDVGHMRGQGFDVLWAGPDPDICTCLRCRSCNNQD